MRVSAPSDEDLVEALGGRVTVVNRRPALCATSHVLELFDTIEADGARATVLRKEVGEGALLPAASRVKPSQVDGLPLPTEVLTHLLLFRTVAFPQTGRPVRCQGWHRGPELDRWWLLLEWWEGVELWQAGQLEAWTTTAEAVGQLHGQLATLAPLAARLGLRAPVQEHMSQAIALAERAGDRDRAATLRAARPAYAQAARRLRALPEGLIHGELYASNILIDDARAPSALRLIDWETTTVACPLLDVAALSSGWDPASRLRIAQAWARGAERADKRLVQGIDLDRDLACAHLVLATRWLGWATDWSPPPRERYDWMRELDQAVAVVTGAARP